MNYRYYLILVLILMISACSENNNSDEYGSALDSIDHSTHYNWGSDETGVLFGEVLYVPVYSSIYHQNDKTFDLTATLSIHNVDINSNITITNINYYDTNGDFVRSFIKEQLVLTPLQSKQIIIKETDISGGTAAKFIIQWSAESKVLKPIIEAVMISTSAQQGISFKTESRVISSIGY